MANGSGHHNTPSGEVQALMLEQLREIRAEQKTQSATISRMELSLNDGKHRMDAHTKHLETLDDEVATLQRSALELNGRMGGIEQRCRMVHGSDSDSRRERTKTIRHDAADVPTEALTKKKQILGVDVATAIKFGVWIGAVIAGIIGGKALT